MTVSIEFSGHGGELRLQGDLSFDTVDALNRKTLQLMRETDQPGLDFSKLVSFDSSVLVYLLSVVKEARAQGKEIVLTKLSDKMKALMKAYGLEGVLT